MLVLWLTAGITAAAPQASEQPVARMPGGVPYWPDEHKPIDFTPELDTSPSLDVIRKRREPKPAIVEAAPQPVDGTVVDLFAVAQTKVEPQTPEIVPDIDPVDVMTRTLAPTFNLELLMLAAA